VEDDLDALLAEDIDLASPKLGLVCADGEEGLDGVICNLGYLRVDSIVPDLDTRLAYTCRASERRRALGIIGRG
jgi:hypothetical protein